MDVSQARRGETTISGNEVAQIEMVGYAGRSNNYATRRRTIRRVTLLNDFRGEGLGSRFGTACIVDKSLAIGELLKDLKVDVPGLTATDGPLSLDDNNRNSANTTFAGLLNLIFDCLDILVRLEVCNGLILTHQA